MQAPLGDFGNPGNLEDSENLPTELTAEHVYLYLLISNIQLLALIRNQMGSKCNPKKPLARVQTPNTPIQYQPPFLVVPFSRLHPSSEEKSPETKVGPRPRAKNIKPNVSAYNNGVPPPTLWRQGPRCRCTGPKINRGQKQVIWLSLGPAQIHAGPKKYPHRVQKTHRQVPQFFVPPGPTKNPARSIKPWVQKKGAQVPENMHPENKL